MEYKVLEIEQWDGFYLEKKLNEHAKDGFAIHSTHMNKTTGLLSGMIILEKTLKAKPVPFASTRKETGSMNEPIYR